VRHVRGSGEPLCSVGGPMVQSAAPSALRPAPARPRPGSTCRSRRAARGRRLSPRASRWRRGRPGRTRPACRGPIGQSRGSAPTPLLSAGAAPAEWPTARAHRDRGRPRGAARSPRRHTPARRSAQPWASGSLPLAHPSGVPERDDKGERLGKLPPCAICAGAGAGAPGALAPGARGLGAACAPITAIPSSCAAGPGGIWPRACSRSSTLPGA
jgi:hypothetical protein